MLEFKFTALASLLTSFLSTYRIPKYLKSISFFFFITLPWRESKFRVERLTEDMQGRYPSIRASISFIYSTLLNFWVYILLKCKFYGTFSSKQLEANKLSYLLVTPKILEVNLSLSCPAILVSRFSYPFIVSVMLVLRRGLSSSKSWILIDYFKSWTSHSRFLYFVRSNKI